MKEQLLRRSIKLSNEILLGSVVELIRNGADVKINISGSSMNPFLLDGDTVVLSAVKYKNIKLGDIILGKYRNAYVLHRVISKNKDRIYIAGDNNLFQIEEIEIADIYAKAVTLVKGVGEIDLTSNNNRIKGLLWYYLRPFRKAYVKIFK